MDPRIIANLLQDPNLKARAAAFYEQGSTRLASLAPDFANGKAARSEKLRRLPVPYELHVQTQVARGSLPFLYSRGKQLVTLFKGVGLELKHASWNLSGEHVLLFMCWDMGFDADLLTHAELVLPDIPEYAQFEQLILEEEKNIVVPISMARRRAMRYAKNEGGRQVRESLLPSQGRYVYVRAEYRVAPASLAEFAACLEASLVPFATSFGWYDGRAFVGVTGRSGEVVQTWIVPESGNGLVAPRLAAAPWQALVRAKPKIQVLEPTVADPVAETNRDQGQKAREKEDAPALMMGF